MAITTIFPITKFGVDSRVIHYSPAREFHLGLWADTRVILTFEIARRTMPTAE
jgi:hypothetical protein